MARPLVQPQLAREISVADTASPPPPRGRRLGALLTPLLLILAILAVLASIAYLRLNGLEESSIAYRQQQSYLPYMHKVLLAYVDNAGSFFHAGLVTLGNAFVGF